MAATSWDQKQPMLLGNGKVPMIVYQALEANSQTFKAGALVYFHETTGAVTACADDATLVGGIAMKDATNVTSGNIEIPVMLFEAGDIIKIQVSNEGTVDSNSETNTAPLERYAIDIDANGVATLDRADAGTAIKNCLIFLDGIRDVNGDGTSWCRAGLAAGTTFQGMGAVVA